MGVIRDCEWCGGLGCHYCEPSPDELRAMRDIARQEIGYGSTPESEPLLSSKHFRHVDAPCAHCQERTVIDLKDSGYFCQACEKQQPIEWTYCVYCELPSAVRRIDSNVCTLCNQEQPLPN